MGANPLISAEHKQGPTQSTLSLEAAMVPIHDFHLSNAKHPRIISLTKVSWALSHARVVRARESHVTQCVPLTLGLLTSVFIFHSAKLWAS